VANERTTFADAFKMADDVLASGVRGVTDLMVMPGLINLDFADIRAVMSEMGKAMMGTGEAEGDRRSIDAAEAAISNPLLEDVSMKGARGVLINITGGLDMTLFEVDEAANRIREEVDPDANIIFGSTFDEKLDGRMRISVVATGIDLDQAREPRPVISLVSDRSREGEAAKPAPSPAPAPAPVAEPVPALALEPSPPQAEAAEQAAVGKGSFIAPRPAEPAPARPAVAAAPPVQPAPVAKQEPAKPKSRMPSLFERVTNAGRLMKRDEPAPGPRVAPAGSPQPRLGTLDPSDRITAPAREEELLDIPAFLRRQAN
jgi:cell division protein FtsZ